MVGCCVVGCGHNSSKPTVDTRYKNSKRNVTFHVFPADLQLRKKWIAAVIIGGRVEEWLPGPNAKICSLHFNLEEIMFNEKGARILKGAVPYIPLATKKKPPRKNKVAMVSKKPVEEVGLEEIRAIEEASTSESPMVVEPPVLVINFVYHPDTPGTPSEQFYCQATSEQMEVEETAQGEPQIARANKVAKSADVHTFEAPSENIGESICSEETVSAVESMKGQQLTDITDIDWLEGLFDSCIANVANDPDSPGTSRENTYPPTSEQMEAEQQIARANKVAKSANVHTFEAPANSIENTANNDPCLCLHGEILEKLKIFNNAVSIHRPDKSEEMQKMLDRFTRLFADKDNMPDQSLMHYYTENIDAWLSGCTDPLDELEFLSVLENSEPCTVPAQK